MALDRNAIQTNKVELRTREGYFRWAGREGPSWVDGIWRESWIHRGSKSCWSLGKQQVQRSWGENELGVSEKQQDVQCGWCRINWGLCCCWPQAMAVVRVDGDEEGRGPIYYIPWVWPLWVLQLPFKISLFFFFNLLYSLDTNTVCSLLNPGYSSKAAKVDRNLGQPVLYQLPKFCTDNLTAQNCTLWSESCLAHVELCVDKSSGGTCSGLQMNPYFHQHKGRKLQGRNYSLSIELHPLMPGPCQKTAIC